MNIQQLMQVTEFETVWERYEDLYRVDENDKEFLEYVYRKLLNKIIKPIDVKSTIKLEYQKDEVFDGEEYFDVTAYEDGSDQRYSFSMSDWDEVVGYEFDANEYDEVTLLAVFLYEITFYGDEANMVEQREELKETSEGIRNGTIETLTFNNARDFLKQLED